MLTRNRSRKGFSVVSDGTEASSPSEKICRICLKEGDIPIFGHNNISSEVMEFGCIEISSFDNLPQHICGACHSLLESAILFRKTAKSSEEILKNTDYLDEDDTSAFSEDQDVEKTTDTDSESYIKREYLEYNDTSASESEMNWKSEPAAEDETLSNDTQSKPDKQVTADDENIEMQLIKVKDEKDEDGTNNDTDNELVMIIVSDKDKTMKNFGCSKCDLTFKSENELHYHDTEIHSNTNVTNQKKCDICSQLVDKNSYRVHIKQHREKYKKTHNQKYGKVECEVCGKKVNKSYYKYHVKMHGTAKEQAERLIECPICKKSFSTNYFSDHMKRVHDKKQRGKHTSQKTKEEEPSKIQTLLKCPVCDKMVNESIYKEHLAKHGGSTKRYICEQCGKVFKHPSAFKTHTLTHGSELKFQCQFCPYRGLHLGLLKIHVRTHTGDYNYKCTECPAKFITKSNLSKHLQRHLGVCNYKCATCNKGFYSKRDVDKHNKTVHLELKNNICEICGKGFGHRDNMLSHQLKVHKREKMTERKGRMPTYLKEENMKSNKLES